MPAYLEPVLRLGAVHPDEIFQAIEPAFTHVFGRGYVPWEWKVGLRNEAVVLLLSALYRLAGALGLHDPQVLRGFLHAPLYGLAVAMLVSVFRITQRRLPSEYGGPPSAVPATEYGGPPSAVPRADHLAFAGMALVALSPLFVFFQTRNLSESWSAAFLVLAFDAIDPKRSPVAKKTEYLWLFLGGLAFGLAEVTRYTSVVLVAPAILARALLPESGDGALGARLRANASKIAAIVAGFVVPMLAVGVLDAKTWGERIPGLWQGGAFHSLISYVDFNFFRGVAARWFGTRPFSFYLPRLYIAAPLFGLWGLVQRRRGGDIAHRRYDGALVSAALYTAALFAMPHKESRFLYPGILLATVAMLPDTLLFLRGVGSGREATRIVARVAVLGGVVFAVVPFFVPGPYAPAHQDGFRAELLASRASSGLLVVGIPFEALGGYSMLGVDKPLCVAEVGTDSCVLSALQNDAVRLAFVTGAQEPAMRTLLQEGRFKKGAPWGRGALWSR